MVWKCRFCEIPCGNATVLQVRATCGSINHESEACQFLSSDRFSRGDFRL